MNAPTGRQPRPQAGAELADQAGADAEYVGERLRIGWRLTLGR